MRNFLLILSVFWLWTCSGGGDKATGPEEPPIVINLTSLGGQAQKGPFNNGTAINIAELTNTLSPTGRNFSSAITDNSGRFSVANVQLESPYVELRANGYYFNEVSNEISSGQLTLFALSNLTGKSSLNVNILTHLEKNRMINLMSGDNPITFAQAKIQSQEEVFAIFDYSRANVPESELLDISQGGAANAKLLAISAILQGDQTVGQMSELLANISTDIATDGTLDDTELNRTLIDNSKNLNFEEIRSNLEVRYSSLGINATIPDFETEVNQFLKPPVVQDIDLSVDEDNAINITLTGSDPEGESITFSIVDDTDNATLSLNGNVVNYTPDTHFNGTDIFTYKANDGTADSNTGTVTITVNAVDDEPNTIDVAATTDEDNAIEVSLNAEEYDGESYSFAIISQPSNGSVSLDGTNATYTPNQDFNGEDTFTFEATDDTGRMMNVATATITVNPINDAPVANDITNQTTDENRMMQLDITLDATDVDGDALTYSFASTNNGSVTINNNIATYVPNQDWNGEDTFTYVANDGSLDSNTATVMITVNSVNDAPVIIPAADNGITNLSEDSSIYEQFKATDVDGDELTFSILTNPSYGTISNFTNDDPDCPGNCASFTYTPHANWNSYSHSQTNYDSLTYVVNDGNLDSEIAVHKFNVMNVGDAPVANDVILSDMIEDDLDGSLSVFHNLRLISPDTGSNSMTPQISLPNDWKKFINYSNFFVEGASSSDDNSYINVYFDDPLNNFDLVLAFDFDGTNWNNFELSTDSQWDQFSPLHSRENLIQQINDHLKLYPWVDTLPEGVDFFSQESGSQWGGHFYIDYSVRLTPPANFNGTEVLNYYGECSCNEGDSNNATITVTVTAVNDEPNTHDVSAVTDEDIALEINLTADEYDGDSYSFAIITDVSYGTTSLNGSTVTYTPNQDFNGIDTFTFEATDDTGRTMNVATATIIVNPINDAPTAVAVNKTMDEDGGTIEVQTNYNDVDGDTDLTFTLVDAPSNGTATVGIPGTYTPNANFHGIDTFTYTVSDAEFTSDPATVTITVNSINDIPVVYDASVSGDEDATSSVGGSSINGFKFILPEATDVESGTSDDFHNSLEIVSLPTHGKIYSNNNEGEDSPENELSVGSAMNNIEDGYGARIWYVQDSDNWYGTDTFTYKANDGEADSNIATVTVTVNPANDPPTAEDINFVTRENVPVEIVFDGSDIDSGASLTYIISSQPTNGTIASVDNSVSIYTPNSGYLGTDTATYVANDGETNSNTASISIEVIAGSAPGASNNNLNITYSQGTLDYTTDLSGAVFDPDNDPLTYYIDSQPEIGSATIDGSTITYTVDESQIGNQYETSLTWYANDNANNSNIATLYIDVDMVLGGYIIDISEYDDDAYISNFTGGLRTADVSYLGESNTGSTGFFVGNRIGQMNAKQVQRDFDRFDYWQDEYSFELNFNEKSLAWDYIEEDLNGFVPFSAYVHNNETGQRYRAYVLYWDYNNSGTWDAFVGHNDQYDDVYGYLNYEPIYVYFRTDLEYDPTLDNSYIQENDLIESTGLGFAQTSPGGTGYDVRYSPGTVYPFVTSLQISHADVTNRAFEAIPPTAANHASTNYSTGSAIFFKTEKSSSRNIVDIPIQIPLRPNNDFIEK